MTINGNLYNDLFLESHRELAIQSLKSLNNFENALIIASREILLILDIEILLDEWRRDLTLSKSTGYKFNNSISTNHFNFKFSDNHYVTGNLMDGVLLFLIKNDELWHCSVSKYVVNGTLIESVIEPFKDIQWYQ